MGDIEKGYDLTSVEQAKNTIDSVKDNPAEQQILELLAAKLAKSKGIICDLGCGPGQVARYFHDRGFEAVGIDLSAGMLKQARKFNPGIRFLKGSMRKPPFKDGELAAIVGFLSLCHIPRWEVPSVLTELRRVLRPSGFLLLAFHLGRGTFSKIESWGKPVSLQTTLFESLELQDLLRAAGYRIEGSTEQLMNGPRGYILAIKPGQESDLVHSLRQAVLTGSAKSVETLLDKGLSPDTTFNGFTSLHFAAGDGRRDVINVLLRAGAKVDIPCEGGGGTPLYIAIQMGQLTSARLLVEAGANPTLTDNFGNTLLHLASQNGRSDIAKWLLKLRVDPRSKNKQEETPELWASRAGFHALASMLKSAGEKRAF